MPFAPETERVSPKVSHIYDTLTTTTFFKKNPFFLSRTNKFYLIKFRCRTYVLVND